MGRIKQWATTGIGPWGYPPGIGGVALRVVVVVTLMQATLVVLFGIGVVVYLVVRSA